MKKIIIKSLLIIMFISCGNAVYGAESEIKGVHILIHDFKKAREAILKLSKTNINTVIWQNKYFYELDNPVHKKQVQDVFNYAKTLGINLIPELQSFGAAEPVLNQYPQAAEGLYASDILFEFKNDTLQSVDNAAVLIENNGFEQGKSGWKFGRDWKIDDDANDGDFSAMIYFAGPISKHSSELKSPKYSAFPESVYSLQFYAKSKFVLATAPALRVVELGHNDRWIRQHFVYIKNNDWQYKELNFKTGPLCRKVYIYANIWEGSGKAWFDDIQLKRLDASLINVLRNKHTDIFIKDAKTHKIFLENEDYFVFDRKIKFPYLANTSPFLIRRNPLGKIKNGQRLKVSYDYAVRMVSFAEWSIPYCPFEPKTYEVMEKAIKNIIELVDPEFIGLGHDEIRGLNRDSRCKKSGFSNSEIISRDVKMLYEFAKQAKAGIKVLIWDDMFNPWHNGRENYQLQFAGIAGGTAEAIDDIPEDIIFLIWWGDETDWLSKIKNSPQYFRKKGFKYFAVGSKTEVNLQSWFNAVEDENNCLGVFTTTWDGIENNWDSINFLSNETKEGEQ